MTLKNDLSRFTQKTQPPNPYEKVFLLKNPFPGPGETSFEVCSGQEEIKDRFIDFLQDFSQDTKRLRINGKNGAGKTNILRYFEKLTDEARRNKLTKNLHPIYVYAPGETYFAIHEQIVDKLAEFFFNDLLRNLKENRSLTKNLASNINAANEILAVINAMIQPMYTSFPLLEERQRDAFIRWLKAQKLTAGDKKLLSDQGTPPAEITSPSLAMRFLYGFLEVLKVLGLSEGIVLLFDEFEEIFEGLTRSRQSQYAQNLRHFFDILKESVFFVVATIPEPRDLDQYPAIKRRLGDPLKLQSIDSVQLAIRYVSDYLENGRDKYEIDQKQGGPGRPSPGDLKPLEEKDVEEEYISLKEEVEEFKLEVLPGYFLPRIRERMRQKVENAN